MLRMICRRPILAGLMCLLGAFGGAQDKPETAIFGREGAQLDLKGGCADQGNSGLWLFVRVENQSKSSDNLETWFVDLAKRSRTSSLEVVAQQPFAGSYSAGCVVEGDTRIAWRLVERRLVLQRLSRSGLGPAITLEGRWDYPASTAALAEGALTLVAANAIGIVDMDSETVVRHERDWILAAWVDPATHDIYSVRAAERIPDSGFPRVLLTREDVLPNGDLKLMAQTDSWSPFEEVEKGTGAEEFIAYEIVTTSGSDEPSHAVGGSSGEALVLRSHFLAEADPSDPSVVSGSSTLHVAVRDKASLMDTRNFVIDTEGLYVSDAAVVAGEVVIGGSQYAESAFVRLLHMDAMGGYQDSAPRSIHDGPTVVDDVELLAMGGSTYAIATQWTVGPSGDGVMAVTVDVFPSRTGP